LTSSTPQFDFTFARHYEVKLLQSAPPVHPLEKLYHFPLELEEGDRSGVYVRVEPHGGQAWSGFFVQGFDSDFAVNMICACPDPGSVCAVVGGYAYVVTAADPSQWFRIEQKPVVALRVVEDHHLILFAGFTTITALGVSGIKWTTERLSWEGVSLDEIHSGQLHGKGWDAIANREVPFEVDLESGQHSGGARPKNGSVRTPK
jgi:hypothetical protein